MKIIVHSMREYILYMIALTGELSIKEFIDSNKEYSQRWIRGNIAELIKEGYVKKHVYKDSNKTITENGTLRIKNPKGEELLKEMSEELLHQYELMSGGKAGERYKGNASRRERLRNEFYLTQVLSETGVEINLLPYEYITINNSPWASAEREKILEEEKSMVENYYKSNHSLYSRDGQILSLNEIKFKITEDVVNYFPIKILGSLRNTKQGKQNVFSRMFGFLMKNQKLIYGYMIYSDNPIWFTSAERKTIMMIKKELFAIGSEEYNQSEEGVFYFNDTEQYTNYLSPRSDTEKKDTLRKNYIRPTDILNHAYMLPLTENHVMIRELIFLEKGMEQINNLLLQDSYIPGKDYDGEINGIHIYNLLSSDMRKLNLLKKECQDKYCIALIHPWQKEGIKRYCNCNDEYLQFKEILPEEFEECIQILLYSDNN